MTQQPVRKIHRYDKVTSAILVSVCTLSLGLFSCARGGLTAVNPAESREVEHNATPPPAESERKDHQPHKQLRIKCKEAISKDDKAICSSVTPPELRKDRTLADAFEVIYAPVDLAGDGGAELVVWESSDAGSSGGQLWVLKKHGGEYAKLFDTEMAWTPLVELPTSTNGWKDLAYMTAGGGVRPFFTIVSYDGKAYRNTDKTLQEQPQGDLLLDQNWQPSTFGPIPK